MAEGPDTFKQSVILYLGPRHLVVEWLQQCTRSVAAHAQSPEEDYREELEVGDGESHRLRFEASHLEAGKSDIYPVVRISPEVQEGCATCELSLIF